VATPKVKKAAAPKRRQATPATPSADNLVLTRLDRLTDMFIDMQDRLVVVEDRSPKAATPARSQRASPGSPARSPAPSAAAATERQQFSPDPIPPKAKQRLQSQFKSLPQLVDISEVESTDSDGSEPSSSTRRKKAKGKKSGRVLTAEYKVAKQLPWPHHFVPRIKKTKKSPAYDQLTVAQFMYGYMHIAERQDPALKTIMHAHMMVLLKDECQYGWEPVRDFHGAWLEEIEHGHATWDDYAARDELRRTFIWAPAASPKSSKFPKQQDDAPDNLVPCKEYNRGKCRERRHHDGKRHICEHCYRSKRQNFHPMTTCRRRDLTGESASKNG
jgi:hypothetical protein